jgi:hypothetical protein
MGTNKVIGNCPACGFPVVARSVAAIAEAREAHLAASRECGRKPWSVITDRQVPAEARQ